MRKLLLSALTLLLLVSCGPKSESESKIKKNDLAENESTPYFDWDAANVYFLLTDRFHNGNTANDTLIKRDGEAATLRGFEGGDIAGIIQKLEEGYFEDLGINAIWTTPIWEQIYGGVDEGTGYSYGFHGYWAKDWTRVEPVLGTLDEYKRMVDLAHSKGIRVLMDVVINHTGPVTDLDPQWPDSWVRTGPTCTYKDQATAVTCTLTSNLPDIRTESTEEVSVPPMLVEKWKRENRYDQEMEEPNAFFASSKLPRTPANYIIKWVTDYIKDTGVDGFRVDTVKHVEEGIWKTLAEQSAIAYDSWKSNNPDLVYHADPFFIVGELYGYEVGNGREFYYSSGAVDYFNYGYDAMINFGFKREANQPASQLFTQYAAYRDSLNIDATQPVTFMNYISSHDDGQPFDQMRTRNLESATKLLLAPGISQVYYGDETGRILKAEGAMGDANLRTMMDWSKNTDSLTGHWQALGRFRRDHPAVGAGALEILNTAGDGSLTIRSYSRNGMEDHVIVGAGLPDAPITIPLKADFYNKDVDLRNGYTGKIVSLNDEENSVTLTPTNGVVLLETVLSK